MKSLKRVLTIFISALLVSSLLVGCSKEAANEKITNKENTTYPLTVTDSYGKQVIINKKPEKIVSLGPNTTEIVYALGLGDKLIGRTDFCDYPSEVSKVPSIGSLMEPNVEKIISLKPDIVLASTHVKEEVINKLKDLGVTVYAVYEKDTFEGTYSIIEKIGSVLGESAKAKKITDDMKAKVSTIENKTKSINKPKVYYVVDFGDNGDYTAGGDTFVGKIIELAGGQNIAKDLQGWQYSFEKIVENDPDIIICTSNYGAKAKLMNAPKYKDLRAVKEGKVFEIDENIIVRQGPRVSTGLEEMTKLLHPELFKQITLGNLYL
jgi:iron complex transport system substrate-binding protein